MLARNAPDSLKLLKSQDLYFVGQWVFPGFGVAGVMTSGYYLAKDILKSEGIDLKKDFSEFFAQ